MGTYEELVVDRSVEAAWLQFRVRLADHLAQMGEDDELVLTAPRAAESRHIRLHLSAGEAETLRLSLSFGIVGERNADRRLLIKSRMAEIGLTAGSLVLGRNQVDRMAQVTERSLRELFGLVHPSFVDVKSADLVLVDEPTPLVSPPPAPELPDVVTVHSQEELAGWVDRALEPVFGHTPRKDDRGNIWVNRGDHRLVIRISADRPIVDLSAVIAKDVDIRKARKQVHRLNDKFYFYRFFVSGDRLMMATTVSARPFAPQHVVEAMNMMLSWLQRRAPKLQAKLLRTEPPVQEAPNGIDADLILLYGAPTTALACALAKGDRATLSEWRSKARTAERNAKEQAAELEHGPAQNALIDAVIAWRQVISVLREALLEHGTAA